VLVDDGLAGALSCSTRAALTVLSQRSLVVVMGMGEVAHYEDAHITAGAVGYWPKDGDVDTLVRTVRAAGLVAQADRACGSARRTRFAQFHGPLGAARRTEPATNAPV
jgi:DNA-binding NarL/FixJ family response regulator